MKRLVFLLALSLLVARPTCAQTQAPPDLEAYRQAIDDALALVEDGAAAPAADLLAGITAVELPGSEIVPVDHGAFVRALRADEPDLDAVAARLAALRAELDDWPVGTVAPDAFDKLAAVLARSEFQPPPKVELDWLSKLLDWLPDLPSVPFLGEALLIGAIVALAAVVAYFASGLWGSFVARAEVDDESLAGVVLTSGQALSRSRERAQAGDYRTAVRLLYLSTLLLLEERNLLRYDRTLTNREYLRQVADRPDLAGELRPVVDTFDEVWYGQIEPDAERYEAYTHQVDHLHEVAE